ncbi:MAG: hypothetical protein E7602_03815 [Ruminococcaceae bacterium]|nr:hypothetical protein [Oscillospiraceae bacterium]
MPIGKNALKRVSNSGYSNVQTKAPDMENSTVAEEKVKAVTETLTPPAVEEAPVVEVAPVKEKKTATKKAAPKKTAPKKSMEKEPDLSPVKTAEKVIKKSEAKAKKQEFEHFSLGDDLPYYLL